MMMNEGGEDHLNEERGQQQWAREKYVFVQCRCLIINCEKVEQH